VDEALANFDPPSQHRVLRALRRFVEWGAAVIAVLYDAALAKSYADRVVLFREGRVSIAGRPAEVLASEIFTEPASV
jgi:iron complex transport system ATP-binding protein